MNKADPLIAAFRQLAVGKLAPRPGPHGGTIAKDGNHKAEHFREQLRLIGQGTKPDPKPEIPKAGIPKAEVKGAQPDLARSLELADQLADVAVEEPTRPKDRADQPNEVSPQQAAAEVTSSPLEWRGPEAALSAVISRLDQAKTLSARDDDATTRVALPENRAEPKEISLKPDDAMRLSKPDEPAEQRFTLTVDFSETRTLPAVKVVVRDQETHFEPVQQPTLLQKIVDRMVTDLPASSPQAGASPADAALPTPPAADKPVRILTLQLDPPDLGAVTVKMRLIGNAVEIHLSADRHETTQMLRQERGALTEVMQSAGYAFDIASIDQTRASDANPGAGQQQAPSDQKPSQQLPGGSQIDNATSERQSGDAQAGTRHNRQQHDQFKEPVERPQDQEVVRNRNGGALYL